MKKIWVIAIAVLVVAVMAVGTGVVLSANGSDNPGQEQVVQEPSYQASISVPEPEPQDLGSQAKITADQAKEAALKANPGATITEVELDNENGNLVWGIEFSSGVEVKVDAGNGQVVHTEQPEPNEVEEEKNETETSEGHKEAESN